MSLYNMLFGSNPAAPALIASLGLTPNDFVRLRDAYISDGKIAVYTRMGGGNYECWCEDEAEGNKCMGCRLRAGPEQHPLYLHGEDDDFDCTYRTLYFSFPEEYKRELEALGSGATIDPSQRWLEMLEALAKARGEKP